MSQRSRIDLRWEWDDTFHMSQGIQIGDTIYLSGEKKNATTAY